MYFRSSENVFADFWVNFGRLEIFENDDFVMVKIYFGFTWNLSVLIWRRFGSQRHVLVPGWSKNGSKRGLSERVPVVIKKNHEHHRISHGLKPLVH